MMAYEAMGDYPDVYDVVIHAPALIVFLVALVALVYIFVIKKDTHIGGGNGDNLMVHIRKRHKRVIVFFIFSVIVAVGSTLSAASVYFLGKVGLLLLLLLSHILVRILESYT